MKTELKLLFKPLLLTCLLALGFASLHFQWWGSFTELDLLNRLFERHWTIAWPVFVITSVVYTALGGPRQLLAFSCGYLMGGLPGALLSTALTGFGALLAIYCVRNIGMEWMRQRHGERVAFIRRLLAEDTWLWICMVRLMPVGSNLATNIAVALAGLSTASVFWGSLLGYLPQMLLFSFAGAGLALQDEQQIWISLLMLVLSTALVLYLYHHGFKQRLQEIRGQTHATPAQPKR
ncbi:TVP38/TMEM64 family protein [Noviherbaspirillum malthae]|uniref:TVP38/TMEM64 family protein n=1 Tax=Noviherbaspirillum malthae TaxID=1260987 RepID=UPI00188DDBBC|nr:VTT domain-containing protein [Noviherbaspirillum malthae]